MMTKVKFRPVDSRLQQCWNKQQNIKQSTANQKPTLTKL